MALVKLFESNHVALGSFLRQLIICRLRCLGFGCGHVLVYSGKLGKIPKVRLVLARISRFREFQGSSTGASEMPAWGCGAKAQYPHNAAVMRRFARVVALPGPKIVIFPAESIVSYGLIAGYV